MSDDTQRLPNLSDELLPLALRMIAALQRAEDALGRVATTQPTAIRTARNEVASVRGMLTHLITPQEHDDGDQDTQAERKAIRRRRRKQRKLQDSVERSWHLDEEGYFNFEE